MLKWALAFSLMATMAGSNGFAEEFVRVEAEGSVPEVVERFVATVEGAGATVFAQVNHGAGAAAVDMPIPDSVLVIFGNPQLGTPALAADPRAGVVLPLRVLVHDDGGQTVLSYQSVDALFETLDVPGDAAVRTAMEGALSRLTTAAATR